MTTLPTTEHKIGDVVSYEDMANPRRVGVIIGIDYADPDKLRFSDNYVIQWDEDGEIANTDLRQHGWRVNNERDIEGRDRAARQALRDAGHGEFAPPTDSEIRDEAIYRVHRRHAGCTLPDAATLADEYDRETLHVASLARQRPWEQVVSKPSPEFLARMRERDAAFDAALGEGRR